MNIEEVKQNTMQALGITDANEVDYITESLLMDYLSASSDAEETESLDADMKSAPYGVYGNSLVYSGNFVYYKRNDKGTPNYGCGTGNWKWTKQAGDTIREIGSCSRGRKEYLLQRAN